MKTKTNKFIAVLLAVVMVLSILPAGLLTVFAAEKNTLTLVSNDMDKFGALSESITFSIQPEEKDSESFTYTIPTYDGSRKQYIGANGSSGYFGINIKSVLNKDIAAITFTYGSETYVFRIEDVGYIPNPSGSSTVEHYIIRGTETGVVGPGVYWSYNSRSGKLSINFSYFDITEDVTIGFNFVSDDFMNASVQTTDAEHTLVNAWTYGNKKGEYVLCALPEAGWYVDHWEYSFNGTDFFVIDGSEGKKYFPVTPSDETDYRVVIGQNTWCGSELTVSVLNKTGVTFDGYLTDKENVFYSANHQKVTDSYRMDMTDIIDFGDSISISLMNISDAEDIQAIVVNLAGETTVFDHVFQQKMGEQVSMAWGNSFMNWNNIFTIMGMKQELARQLTAENGIDIKIIYEDPNTNFNVTTLTNDAQMGNVPNALAVDGQYLLVAIPEEGYALDYWEYAAGTDATEGFQKLEGSDGKASFMVSMDKDMTYRAVFISADQKAIDFTGSEIGIRKMQYTWQPRNVMWNNCPEGLAPEIPVSTESNRFLVLDGSVSSVNVASVSALSSAVTAGEGAELWFTFKYYSELKDITVKAYAGAETDENSLLYTLTADSLKIDESESGTKKGTGICYMPVIGMPDTDKITVTFTENGVTSKKTFSLETAVVSSNVETEKIDVTKNVLHLYNNLNEQLKAQSITYQYSSQYLMLREELSYGLTEIAEGETKEKVAAAYEKAVKYMNDAVSGIYHHGVDACIDINNNMYVARVPQIDNVFTAMCAALEQAYPNGHWYYTVGVGTFGIFFGHAGYVADPEKHSYGVDYNSSFASSTYSVADYFGRPKPVNRTNGLSNQCVWDGIRTNTPTKFDATGAHENMIKFNFNYRQLAWDMARLRQHYSDEELLGNAVYEDVRSKQTGDNDADAVLDKALKIEYADFFFCNETQATRNVIRAIGTLNEQSSKDAVDGAYALYNTLSDDEKRGVFNYEDLLPLLQLKEDELTALETDLKINNIGKVEYTEDCRAKIEDARSAYACANADAQALVTKLDTLISAETTFAELAEEKKNEFIGAVKDLPSAIVYPDSKAAVDAVQSAWDSLLNSERNALTSEKSILDQAQAEYESAKIKYYSSRLDGALERVLTYIDKTVTAPQVGSVGGEWAVLAQARAGVDKEQYYESYYKTVAEYVVSVGSDKLDERKSTENSRVILALSSIGKNAANVGGYDLTAPYADFDWIKKQGLNGVIFALLALDSGNYEISENSAVSTQTTREKLIDEILNAQLKNGGWTYSGDNADPDMTAMALQALTPYRELEKVASAIDSALTVLQSLQNSDGSFGSDAADSAANVESTSQVIIALLTLGINPVEDSRFIKGSANLFTAILAYQLENGSFEHEIGSGSDQMATEQAAMALTAYQRFLNHESALYVMTDKEQIVDPFVPVNKDDENNTSQNNNNASDLTTVINTADTEKTDHRNDSSSVETNNSKKSPMTGNNTDVAVCFGITVLLFTGFAVIAMRKRKEKQN